jgi:beta-phosphoglucomutase-like phosphatase (HAD superfamily)
LINNIRAILFDLDGLLVATEKLHAAAYSAAFGRFGVTLNEEEIYRKMGIATRENVRRIMGEQGIPQSKYKEILKLRYDIYHTLVKRTPLAFKDGAVECLEYIIKKNLKKGLVTSSIREHALSVLENLMQHSSSRINLLDYFDVLVFGDDIDKSKPDPEIYTSACTRLDIKPGHCVALEDSEAGVLSAKSAGLFVIAVPNSNTVGHNLENADIKLVSLREIMQKNLFS